MRTLILIALFCCSPLAAQETKWELEPCDAEVFAALKAGQLKLPEQFLDQYLPEHNALQAGARWRFEVQDGDGKRVLTYQTVKDLEDGQKLYEIGNGRGLVFAYVANRNQRAQKAWVGRCGEAPSVAQLESGFADDRFSRMFLHLPLNTAVLGQPAESSRTVKAKFADAEWELNRAAMTYQGVRYEITSLLTGDPEKTNPPAMTPEYLYEYKVEGKTIGKLLDARLEGAVSPLLDWSAMHEDLPKPQDFTPPPRPDKRVITQDLGARGTLVHVFELFCMAFPANADGKDAYPDESGIQPANSLPGHLVLPKGGYADIWQYWRPDPGHSVFAVLEELQPHIGQLKLHNTVPSDLAALAKLKSLKRLSLGLHMAHPQVKLEPLAAMAELRSLDLLNVGENVDLTWMAKLSKLERFDSYGPSACAALPALAKLKAFTSLSLQDVAFNKSQLDALLALSGLRELKLNDCTFVHADVAPGSLQVASLEIGHARDLGRKVFAALVSPALRSLSLSGRGLNDEHFESLTAASGVTLLRLDEVEGVGDGGMKHLAGMAALETAVLLLTDAISDAGLDWLKNCGKLKKLLLRQGAANGAFLAHLPVSIEGLDLGVMGLDDEHLPALGRLANLRDLRLFTLAGESAAYAKGLAKLDRLEKLYVGFVDSAGDEMLKALEGKTALREVELEAADLYTDEGLKSLSSMPGLRDLTLAHLNGLGKEAPAIVKTFKQLKSLSIYGCFNESNEKGIGPDHEEEVARALPGCKVSIR